MATVFIPTTTIRMTADDVRQALDAWMERAFNPPIYDEITTITYDQGGEFPIVITIERTEKEVKDNDRH